MEMDEGPSGRSSKAFGWGSGWRYPLPWAGAPAGSAPLPVPQNAWDEAEGVDAMHDQGSCLGAISPLRSLGPIPADTEVAASTVTPSLQTP